MPVYFLFSLRTPTVYLPKVGLATERTSLCLSRLLVLLPPSLPWFGLWRPLCCLTVNIKCTQQLPIQLQTKLQAQTALHIYPSISRCSYSYSFRYRCTRAHRYRCNYTYCAAALGQCAFPFGLIALPTRWQPCHCRSVLRSARSCQRAATSRSVKFLFNFVFISAPHAAQRTPFICLEHVSMWCGRGGTVQGLRRGHVPVANQFCSYRYNADPLTCVYKHACECVCVCKYNSIWDKRRE